MTDHAQITAASSLRQYLSTLATFADVSDARIVVAFGGVIAFVIAVVALPSVPAMAFAVAVYGNFATALLFFAARTGTLHRFGWANSITTIRVIMAAVLAGALIDAPAAMGSWWLGILAGTALLSDVLDGFVARHQGESSAFGAHFDREVDAGLVLILSLLLWLSGKIGIWIVAAGLMRYALMAAGQAWPFLAAPLPESRFRSAVCGVLVGALVICLLPIVDSFQATIVGAAALSALTVSFGKDLMWLHEQRLKSNT